MSVHYELSRIQNSHQTAVSRHFSFSRTSTDEWRQTALQHSITHTTLSSWILETASAPSICLRVTSHDLFSVRESVCDSQTALCHVNKYVSENSRACSTATQMLLLRSDLMHHSMSPCHLWRWKSKKKIWNLEGATPSQLELIYQNEDFNKLCFYYSWHILSQWVFLCCHTVAAVITATLCC
jgi:hypothetical protein